MTAATDTARAIFEAYVAKDRPAAERLIAEGFRFTSPLDNGLDRDAYFRICWPNSEGMEGFDIVSMAEVAAENASRVFVTYEGRVAGGRRFRNTEALTIRDGRITAVEVYFGWNLPHDAPPGEHRDLNPPRP